MLATTYELACAENCNVNTQLSNHTLPYSSNVLESQMLSPSVRVCFAPRMARKSELWVLVHRIGTFSVPSKTEYNAALHPLIQIRTLRLTLSASIF